ncbi:MULTISPECIES: hypothetical protein [Rhizobium]|uniref:hypothetical protein n=1 Tax=Rhizobium TaxID=379 RepID=UPI0010395184|nr:hypothetical protein [Rhizobium leguminosarum]NKL99062.1 hypothetical protein [Rhizobium leguminosarum bv. viciae]TCA06699.1 hypothetical protein E0H57_11760 [Rhizobium leguminosarum bv. viciae]UFW76390.1 hypothetical protein RlegSU303_14055 [Rhizobium leguminosarum bv. viciae]
MQRLLLSGLALAALAGTAFAQQPPAPPSAGTPPAAAEAGSPPPPPSPSTPDDDEQMTDRPDARPGDRPDYRWHGRRGDMGFRGDRGFRRHRPLPPPHSKAAHFRIEDGNTQIDLKCAEDEPMKVCADLLLQVMDRLQGQD